MSFVTTHPEALAAAAGNLQTIGAALAAQNAAAATPTTGVIPAGADEVSALQATQFAAYGNLYQQISAQATAIHEMFVNTLGLSAGSYGDTEAANSVAASSGSGLSGLIGLFTGNASGPYGLLASMVGNTGVIAAMQAGNFGSAASDLFEFGSAGLSAPGTGTITGTELASAETVSSGGSHTAVLAGAAGPAGSAGAPVSAGIGQGSSVGKLSVPPSWVAPGAAVSSAPTTLAGAGWTAAAPQSTSVAAMPAGMPAAGSTGRGGFGVPRYGVKPTVMPKPAVV